MPKKSRHLILLFLLVCNIHVFGDDYYSINKIISFYKLSLDYEIVNGLVVIKNQKKQVKFLLNSPYIVFGEKKVFINDFIKQEQLQIFLPLETAKKVLVYFDDGRYSFTIKENDIEIKDKNSDIEITEKHDNLTDKPPDNIRNDQKIVKTTTTTIKSNTQTIKKEQIFAIIIDPGHGGKDPGAVGYNGIKEKDIVLRAALMLKEKLSKLYPYKKIVVTRSKDEFIELEERSDIANNVTKKYGQSIFIAIHVNASRSPNIYGFETWNISENYTRKIVNKGSISKDNDVEDIINSMLNDKIYRDSRSFAQYIQNGLELSIGKVSTNRGIKEEVYFVIKKSLMPAVLVEVGFNTNKYEAIRLTKYSYLDNITNGILKGIKDFIYGYEHN